VKASVLAAGLGISICASAHAGSTALADEFVGLMNYDTQYRQAHALCLDTKKSMTPEKLLNITDENPGLVAPGSKFWPMVTRAYDEYWQDVCAHPTKDEYLGVISQSYARTMSDEELRASIAFYSSETGKSLIKGNLAVVRDLYSAQQKTYGDNMVRAMNALRAKLEQVGEAVAKERCRELHRDLHSAKSDCPLTTSKES